jgi:hypothetical protein
MPKPPKIKNKAMSLLQDKFPNFIADAKQLDSLEMQKKYGEKFRNLLINEVRKESGIFSEAFRDSSFRKYLLNENWREKEFKASQYIQYLTQDGKAGLLEAKAFGELFKVNVIVKGQEKRQVWSYNIHEENHGAPTIILNNYTKGHFFLENPDRTRGLGKNLCLYNCFVEFFQQSALLQSSKEMNKNQSNVQIKADINSDRGKAVEPKSSIDVKTHRGEKSRNIDTQRNALNEIVSETVPLIANSPITFFNAKGQANGITTMKQAMLSLYDSIKEGKKTPEGLDPECAKFQKEEIESWMKTSR